MIKDKGVLIKIAKFYKTPQCILEYPRKDQVGICVYDVNQDEVSFSHTNSWGKTFLRSDHFYCLMYFSKMTEKLHKYPNLVFSWVPECSLAETTESAGTLKYFAQICLQIFTSFLQIYDVQRS